MLYLLKESAPVLRTSQDIYGPGLGQRIFIAFSEVFWQYRRIMEENRKLIDELVEAQRQLHPEYKQPTEPVVFSKRDKEELPLIAKGFSNKEIADRLSWPKAPSKTESVPSSKRPAFVIVPRLR